MEPCVLLEEKREGAVTVDDLDSMWRVDVARHSERQTTSGVVPVLLGVVILPLLQSPLGIRKIKSLRLPFGIGQRLTFMGPVERHPRCRIQSIGSLRSGHIGRIWIGPMAAEVRFAV